MPKQKSNGIFKKIVITIALAWAAWISLGMVDFYSYKSYVTTKLEYIEQSLKDIKHHFGIPNYGKTKP